MKHSHLLNIKKDCVLVILKKRSISEFHEAYRCMAEANVFNEDIVNGEIYALIIDKHTSVPNFNGTLVCWFISEFYKRG